MKPALWITLGVLAAAAGHAETTPTPTPVPARLSGGFGRAKATPAPATSASGQSLADAVRAAHQPRETPRSGVAITNQTLVKDPNRGRLSTWQGTPAVPAPAATASPTPAAERTSAATAATTPAAGDAASEEAKWGEIASRARQRVADAKDRVSRLEADTRKLESEFYSWDDGQYRDNVIKPNWDKKREELETARRELDDAEKELAELPERARKAGALPGWIRE